MPKNNGEPNRKRARTPEEMEAEHKKHQAEIDAKMLVLSSILKEATDPIKIEDKLEELCETVSRITYGMLGTDDWYVNRFYALIQDFRVKSGFIADLNESEKEAYKGGCTPIFAEYFTEMRRAIGVALSEIKNLIQRFNAVKLNVTYKDNFKLQMEDKRSVGSALEKVLRPRTEKKEETPDYVPPAYGGDEDIE